MRESVMSTSEEHYTHGHHESVLRSHSWRNIDNSAGYLATSIEPGMSVLDIGCGPGTITVDFAQRVAPGHVVGIDSSADVVARAATDAAELDLANVEFRVGNAYRLEFGDDTFDIVHAHQTLQHVADPVAVLREMQRVVRPGGLIAARDADYAAMFWYPEIPELDEWMALYQAVHRSNGGDPDAGRSLRRWALAAGLTDTSTSGSMWTHGTPDERAWWGGLWADRIIESAFAPQAVALGITDEAGLRRIADGWRRWAAAEDGWFGVPHGEILARKPQQA